LQLLLKVQTKILARMMTRSDVYHSY
jgi:hypothetical protein